MMILLWITIGLFAIGLLIAGTAYSRLMRIYEKYEGQEATVGIRCVDYVAKCIDSFDLGCKIALTDKKLGDAYSSKNKIIILDKNIAYSTSVAALSIASHEIGHAIQDNKGSFLIRLDDFIKTIFSVLKFLAVPVLIAGLIFLFVDGMFNAGVIMLISLVSVWVFSIIARLCTIPMEMQASKIAYDILKDNRILTRAELKITKKLLNAAALTYVAALFINILNFFRIIKYSFRK